jgi:hypothetical protein
MKALASGLGWVVGLAAAIALVSALLGLLAVHLASVDAGLAQAFGWGMCFGGAAAVIVVGQSGSPTRMAAESRWGYLGQYWGRNPALPESPLWALVSGALVFAGGIALIVLTY